MILTLSLVLVLSSAVPVQTPAPASSLIKVFVGTGEATGSEQTELLGSVKDLSAALAAKKKSLTLVESGSLADITVTAVSRSIEAPRVVFGVEVRRGSEGTPTSRVLRAILSVRITSGETRIVIKNKNVANDNPKGWKSAAEDLADQIDKWVKDNRVTILARR